MLPIPPMPPVATMPPLLDSSRPRTVCLVLMSGIGDLVHAMPLANDLKRLNPEHRVVAVAEPAPAAVLEHHPAIDEVVIFHRRAGLAGVKALRRAMKPLRADLTINTKQYFKSVWPTLFAGSSVRVGLPRSKTRDGIHLFHTHLLPEGPWQHVQDMFLDFRPALGVDRAAPVRWDLTLSAEERAAQAAFLAEIDDREVAALVVGSANPHKDWPADRLADLADALAFDHGYRVLLVGGPSATERRAADVVLGRAGGEPLDCLGDDVRRLLWLIDGSSLVVAPDTGPLHLAHASGVPVIGLYGHTNPARVGPYRDSREFVIDRYTEPGEAPSPARNDAKEGRMETITVDDVLEKVAMVRRGTRREKSPPATPLPLPSHTTS